MRLLAAAAVWLVVSLAAWPLPLLARVLLGFAVAGFWFAGHLVWHLRRKDATETKLHAVQDDPGPGLTDVVVSLVGLLALVGDAGVMIFGDGDIGTQRASALVAIAAVAAGWVCVHTVYTLRYARLYYAADGGPGAAPPIDFNQDEDPRYTDFAYFAFNLGMTYQVSDTNVRSSAVRRVVLTHCLQSWVFGTVVIASAVNLVAGLGSG